MRRKGTKGETKKWRVGIFRFASRALCLQHPGPISSAVVVLAQVGTGPLTPFSPEAVDPPTFPDQQRGPPPPLSRFRPPPRALLITYTSPFFCVPLGFSPSTVPSWLCGFLGTIIETVSSTETAQCTPRHKVPSRFPG